MVEEDPAIAAELAVLRAAFDERLGDDLAAFGEPLSQGSRPPPLDRLRPLAPRAHRLAGAAGSFGEVALSAAARRFEELCAEEAGDAAAEALYELVLELRRVLQVED